MIRFEKTSVFSGNAEEISVEKVVKTERLYDVNAVYVDFAFEKPLDSELGVALDMTIKESKRFMADYRYKEFWCCPSFCEDVSLVPNQTQCLFVEKNNGKYLVILPVVSEKYKCTLVGTEDKLLRAELYSWYENLNECKCLAFLWAEGDNPFDLVRKCAEAGVKLLGNKTKLISERKYPEMFEYLGWCSWDAFEIRVSEESIFQKCREFKEKDVPVKWMIIDDMWAEVRDFYDVSYETREDMFKLMHSSHLYSFKADPKRFPNGLKACINGVNDFGIKVGMWHPTTGYWKGIDKSGEIYERLKDVLIDTNEDMCICSYEYEKAYKFYTAFHDYLKSCGTEFVKIDNQSMTRRFYKKLAPVGIVSRQFHDAIERSVSEHFDGKMINCMGMASEDMWNRSESPISRCSDDFQPEDRPWFTKHILQCTYNSLVQGQFYFEDYDMWWTDDGQAKKNSILRAVSGGPIYVSDKLNRTNADILKPLCLRDGKILRCERPGVPALDSLFENPTESKKPFKVQNVANGCGILAVFNLNIENKSVSGEISVKDVEGLNGDEFGFYENLSGELKIVKADEKIKVELNNNDDFKLYIIVPLKNGNGFIGRTDKFISPLTYNINANGEKVLIEKGPYAEIVNRKLKVNGIN